MATKTMNGYNWSGSTCIGVTLSKDQVGDTYMSVLPRYGRTASSLKEMKERRATKELEASQVFALLEASGYSVLMDGSDIAVCYKR